MASGGFNGSDSTLTLEQFKQLVRQGSGVRYYVVSQHGPGGHGGRNRRRQERIRRLHRLQIHQPKRKPPIIMVGRAATLLSLPGRRVLAPKVDYGGTQYTVYDLINRV